MSITTVTHLNFRGNARQALAFYHAVFGGQIAAISYKDAGADEALSTADQVMWGQVKADNGFHVMAYDVPAAIAWNPGENAFFVSLRGETAQEITAHWDKLCDGARIVQALAPAPWSPLYGMLQDRFGVVWVLDVAVSYTA